MSMRTATTRAITAITIIVTRITAAVRASTRKGLGKSTSRSTAAFRVRRRALRISARSRPTKLIPPQYLPALARAQSLRRMSQLATTTARRR